MHWCPNSFKTKICAIVFPPNDSIISLYVLHWYHRPRCMSGTYIFMNIFKMYIKIHYYLMLKLFNHLPLTTNLQQKTLKTCTKLFENSLGKKGYLYCIGYKTLWQKKNCTHCHTVSKSRLQLRKGYTWEANNVDKILIRRLIFVYNVRIYCLKSFIVAYMYMYVIVVYSLE